MNNCIISGKIVVCPEYNFFPARMWTCRGVIASDSHKYEKKYAYFFFIAVGEEGERISSMYKEGCPILIRGQ